MTEHYSISVCMAVEGEILANIISCIAVIIVFHDKILCDKTKYYNYIWQNYPIDRQYNMEMNIVEIRGFLSDWTLLYEIFFIK